MSQLLENTYSAYESFLEGELNQYDLMSLVEEGIISGEVLESILIESGLVDVEEDDEELEEGEKLNKLKSIGKKALIGSAVAGTLIGGANAYHQHLNDKEAYYNKKIPELQRNVTNTKIDIMNNNSLSQHHFENSKKYAKAAIKAPDKETRNKLNTAAMNSYAKSFFYAGNNPTSEAYLKYHQFNLDKAKDKAASYAANRKYDIIHHLKNLKNSF